MRENWKRKREHNWRGRERKIILKRQLLRLQIKRECNRCERKREKVNNKRKHNTGEREKNTKDSTT